METGFGEKPQALYSPSQIARVDTEAWAAKWMYCPNCENPNLSQFSANRPVADFYCDKCGDQFELKSQNKKFGKKIANGAYHTKLERLSSNTSPNLLLLQYNRDYREVVNLQIIPNFYFTSSVVEERPPLAKTARRAGWIGSNILLEKIPSTGRIGIIENGAIRDRAAVIDDWKRTSFLGEKKAAARGWLLSVMQAIEAIGEEEFDLADIYEFEAELSEIYPANSHVRPKIRQQLQVLRDSGYLTFQSKGRYRRT